MLEIEIITWKLTIGISRHKNQSHQCFCIIYNVSFKLFNTRNAKDQVLTSIVYCNLDTSTAPFSIERDYVIFVKVWVLTITKLVKMTSLVVLVLKIYVEQFWTIYTGDDELHITSYLSSVSIYLTGNREMIVMEVGFSACRFARAEISNIWRIVLCLNAIIQELIECLYQLIWPPCQFDVLCQLFERISHLLWLTLIIV